MDEQVEAVLSQREIVAFHGWSLEADGLNLYVTMHAGGVQGRTYLARFGYVDYPQHPPGFAFVDPSTRREGREFWPNYGPFSAALSRGSPPQICIPGTREFHELVHREQAWVAEKHPLIKVLEAIQAELNKGH